MSLPRFTAKEISILELLIEGLSNKQIGKHIGNTRCVVAKYLGPIYDKSGMGTRLELAVWYVAHRNEILESGNL